MHFVLVDPLVCPFDSCLQDSVEVIRFALQEA